MGDAADIDYQEREQDSMDERGLAVEVAVLAVIASRLKRIKRGSTFAQARVWQTKDMARIEDVLARGASMLEKRSDGIMADMAKSSDEWAGAFYEAAGVLQTPVAEDPFMAATLRAGTARNRANVENICQTSVLRLVSPDGMLVPIAEAYRRYVDSAITAVFRSEKDYNQAIARAVRELSRTGLRVQYASGITRELYAAVSGNVMDGFRGTMQEVRDQQAEQFGADGVEVSAHGMCAPDHLPYQGRQFTRERFERIQRKLERPIGHGMNCRHMVTGIILGVSSKVYDKAERERLVRESQRKTGVYNASGRELTAYEFSQWQRAQETAMRKTKARRMLERKAGLSTLATDNELESRLANYRAASRKAGVETREERIRVYDWD